MLVKNNAVLIGDAAHLHSPLGARGMNLGIEDAFISSRLIHENKLDNYDGQRRAYVEKTVHRINNLTMGLAGKSTFSRMLRNKIEILRLFFPIILPRAPKFILGLNK